MPAPTVPVCPFDADGHGANGHLVSNYLVAAVPMALAAALESAPSVSQAWAQAFSSCHSEVSQARCSVQPWRRVRTRWRRQFRRNLTTPG